MGINGHISRSNLARVNENHDWRIYENFSHHIIKNTLIILHNDEHIYIGHNKALYALESTIIDLCLTLTQWTHHRKNKSSIKLHTLLD